MPNWNDVLQEIQSVKNLGNKAVDVVRRKYLKELHEHTNRNVIAYYSGFLSKPDFDQLEINDEDKNGFMMAVHKLDRSQGLDLILHTHGGSIAATQSIVNYLHKMFKNIGNVQKMRHLIKTTEISRYGINYYFVPICSYL